MRHFRSYVLDILHTVGCPHLGDEESFPAMALFPYPVSLTFSSTADTAAKTPMSTSLASQTVSPNINISPLGMTPSPRQVVTARAQHIEMTSCDSQIGGWDLVFHPFNLSSPHRLYGSTPSRQVLHSRPPSALLSRQNPHPINSWPGHIPSIHNTHGALRPARAGATRGGGAMASLSCRDARLRRPVGTALGSAVRPGVERASRGSFWMVAEGQRSTPDMVWRRMFGRLHKPRQREMHLATPCSSRLPSWRSSHSRRPWLASSQLIQDVVTKTAATTRMGTRPIQDPPDLEARGPGFPHRSRQDAHLRLLGAPEPGDTLRLAGQVSSPMGDLDVALGWRLFSQPAPRCCRRGFRNQLALNSLKRELQMSRRGTPRPRGREVRTQKSRRGAPRT